LAEVSLKFDTAAANWWQGGEVYAYVLQAHGTTLTPRFVGDGQYYSNLDTGPKPQDLTELAEFWYQQTFLDEKLSVRVGRQDANADFAYADYAADFLNSSFTTLPNIPLPFWPFQALGVSAWYEANPGLKVGGGVFDHGRDKNQWWLETANRGLFFLGQADYLPFQGSGDGLPTLIRAGLWYTNSDTWAVNKNRVYDGNYGVYFTIDRTLYREPGTEDQGLDMFVQASWAPPDRNQVDWSYGGGWVYRGPLPGRDADAVGVGFTLIAFSSVDRELTGRTYENAVELLYSLRMNAWSVLKPDIQYISHPGGIERDALVVGLRWEMTL
jgi:porin